MKPNLIIGAIVFIAWSGLCTWYYVCQIKGLCIESPVVAQVVKLAPPEPVPVVVRKVNTVEVEPKIVPIEISEDKIYFRINSDYLLDESYVQQFVDGLKSQVLDRSIQIDIVGYTCDRGASELNLKLGLKRAEFMKNYLVINDFSSEDISVSSFGEVASVEGTEEERQSNRKVSIIIKSTKP